MKFNKKNIYITLFGILYIGVALVSLIHAVSFFALANLLWLAILLAIIFEIGQSAVLFSILTSSTGKSKVMPWVLMCILTAVQILGNVFSSYKYIVTNSPENLRFFKEPVFIWTTIPDAQATVIITYIVGGILPLVALAMSAMVTNYLEDENAKNQEEKLKELDNIHSNELNQAQHLKESDEDEPKVEDEQEVEDEEIPDDKEYTITFKDGEKIVRSITGKMGTYVSVPYVEKEGYEFLGWSIDGKKVTMPVDGIYDSDITYVALWEKKQQEETKTPIVYNTTEEDKKKVENILGKKQIKKLNIPKENFEQIEDLIKNGIQNDKQDTEKVSHFINQ